jgi:hypothetical protein
MGRICSMQDADEKRTANVIPENKTQEKTRDNLK